MKAAFNGFLDYDSFDASNFDQKIKEGKKALEKFGVVKGVEA